MALNKTMGMLGAVRRLSQIHSVFQPFPSRAMRLYGPMMNGYNGETNILRMSFSDIEANLLTSEAKCLSFIEHYTGLHREQRGQFLCDLAKNYGIDKDAVFTVTGNVIAAREQGEASLLGASDRLRTVLRPKYKTLFTHLGRVNGGVKFLVDLRSDVLSLRQSNNSELNGAYYQELNSALRELLMLWFTVGFLNLERITWNSPCDLVQKVSNYEAVHRIKTWEDIKRRVGPYRRCYIFTHNSMPREPVVVLHTALTNEISSSIHSIIQSARFRQSPLSPDGGDNGQDFFSIQPPTPTPRSPGTLSSAPSFSPSSQPFPEEEKEDVTQISCAVFYSITSTQKGLQGIEMGNYLIKSVVKKLLEEFPHLQQFSSLSPIPGFKDWLISTINYSLSMSFAGEIPEVPVLLPDELAAISAYKEPGHSSALETFREQVINNQWYRNEGLKQVMMGPLLRICAHYLYVQKRRQYALNPVANFHLSNGAVLWRINFLADTSQRGLSQSCSMMVNYRYFLESTESNSRDYLENYKIHTSQAILDILRVGRGNET